MEEDDAAEAPAGAASSGRAQARSAPGRPRPGKVDDEVQGHWTPSIVFLLISIFCGAVAGLAGVTALGKQMFDLTGRELDLGFLGLAEFAPAALLVLVTGTVADRYDRRAITAVAALAEAAGAVGLAWYASTTNDAVAPIFLLVIAFGTARAFVAPATRSLPADLLPPEELPWLIARTSFTWQFALVFGPVLGGTLYAVDPSLPYVAMAGLLLVAALAIVAVRVDPRIHAAATAANVEEQVLEDAEAELAGHLGEPGMAAGAPQRGRLSEALEGLRLIRREPVLLGAISLDLFAVLFGGAVALLPAIAEEQLGVGAVGLGWLRAAGGIGAAAVTLRLARHPLRRHVGRTLLIVVATFGVATIVLGLTSVYVVAFLAMLVLSGADAVSVFIRATLVPLLVPSDRRGRVMAVENVFIGASNELGAFESGVAGQALGAPGAIVLGGVATVAVAASWSKLFPALRDIDRFPNMPVIT